MQRNKIFFVIMALVLPAIAAAGVLNLQSGQFVNNSIIKDGTVYQILDDDSVIVINTNEGARSYRRIIVQNFTKIEEMKLKELMLSGDVEAKKNRLFYLDDIYSNLTEEKQRSSATLSELENQVAMLSGIMEETQVKETELRNNLTGKVSVSPLMFRIGIVVFLVLLIAVLIVKGSTLMGGGIDATKSVKGGSAPAASAQPAPAPEPAVNTQSTNTQTSQNKPPQ